jgi:hypothetical protein
MLVKLLVLGRPGSGKTTAFRRINTFMRDREWSVTRIRDYEILRRMFRHDTEQKKFRLADHGGFDVVDFSVLDSALVEVENQVRSHMPAMKENELVIIELARSDYKRGLEPFSSEFLQDAHILFVDADVETCIQRVHQRIVDHVALDNHFVSDHIMRSYYCKDNRPYMKYLAALSTEAYKAGGNSGGIVQCIENAGSRDTFYAAIDGFIAVLLAQVLHLNLLPQSLISNTQIGCMETPRRGFGGQGTAVVAQLDTLGGEGLLQECGRSVEVGGVGKVRQQGCALLVGEVCYDVGSRDNDGLDHQVIKSDL